MSMCDTPVNYTGNVPSLTDINWESQPYFKYSLFGGLHKAANATLSWIFPDHEEYRGYRINPEDLLDFTEDNVDVDDMIWNNRGPLAFTVIGVILAALITIIGIGWCFVKCCGMCCCSRKSKATSDRYNDGYFGSSGYEERKEKRIRICCGVTLIVWIIFSLAFLGSLFAFNEQLRDGIDGITSDLKLSLNDAETYLQTSQRQIDGVLVTSYLNFSYALNCTLEGAQNQRDLNSYILQFEQVAALSKQLEEPDIERNLNLTIEVLSELCADKSCAGGEQELSKNLSTMAFTLNQITVLTKSLKEFAMETLPKLYEAGKQLIIINDVGEDIWREGENLRANAKLLTDSLDEVIDAVKEAREDLTKVENEFDKVNPPLYSSILVIVLFLLLVTILFFVGAVLSFVGKSHRAVTKSRSITLGCGLMLIFIFGGMLWLFTMACFLLSGVVTQVVPANLRALENGTNAAPPTLLGASKIGTRAGYNLPTYGHIARNCREGSSAYVTFDLHQVFDVASIKELTNVLRPPSCRLLNSNSASAASFVEAINEIAAETSNFTTRLQQAQNQTASLTVNMELAIIALEELADGNDGDGSSSNDAISNRKLKSKLAVLNSTIRQRKLRTTDLLKLKTGLESLGNILGSAAPDLSKVRETPAEICRKFEQYVADYADFVYEEIYFNVGECKPMYNALNSTINLFTYKIGSPIAGFWFSLNIVMLLFFASVITAIVLQRI